MQLASAVCKKNESEINFQTLTAKNKETYKSWEEEESSGNYVAY